ncbi:MAG: flavin reductase family protein, partial [Agathobacter sp.]|nr:flavin reductase family protein [Agathobacter sp.]
MNKSAFHQLSYGVYVVSTWDNGRATGCTANSAMQITSDPATIAVSINHDNYTNQCIQSTGRFAISVLGENTDPGVIGTFGFKSGKDYNKFDDVKSVLKGNMPVVADACAYIACEVIDKMETSTHTVFLGKVLDADILKKDEPMTYAY